MLKRMTLLARRTDETFDQFSAYWWNNHGQIVKRMPSVHGYVQNHIRSRLLADVNYVNQFAIDGIVELWFTDESAQGKAFSSNAAKELPLDEPNFIRGITIFTVNEITSEREPLEIKIMVVARVGIVDEDNDVRAVGFVETLTAASDNCVRTVNWLGKAGWRDHLWHEPSPPNVIVELTFGGLREAEAFAASKALRSLHAEIVSEGGGLEVYHVEPRRVI